MFTITKSFDFEYAHRVYTQNVDSELAREKTENTCRHLHGHSGKLTVTLSAPSLDQRGFVIDYKEMGFIKALVKEYLDHKTILSIRDPLWISIRETFQIMASPDVSITQRIRHVEEITKEYPGSPPTPNHLYEFYEGISLVDIIPTSESLAELFFKIIEEQLTGLGLSGEVRVEEVSWSETPSSTATYRKAYYA